MAAPSCAATAGSIITPVDGAVVSVGGADCDAGGSGLVELRAATGVEVLINFFILFILFNESLMKLTSSPFPHHVARSEHSRKLCVASGIFGRCPSQPSRRNCKTPAPAFFVRPSAIMSPVGQ